MMDLASISYWEVCSLLSDHAALVTEYAAQMESFLYFYLQGLQLIQEVIGQQIQFIELNGLLMGSFFNLPKLLKWYAFSLLSF